MDRDDDDASAESRRILSRISKDWDSGSPTSPLARQVDRAQSHFAAADADQDDWIEVWGTRIGRTIGVFVLAALAVGLAIYLFRSG